VVGVESPVWVEPPFIRVGRAADVGVLIESEKVFVGDDSEVIRAEGIELYLFINADIPIWR
jgi:hypothetical protein